MKYVIAALVLALSLCGWGLYREIQSGAIKSEQITGLTEAVEQAAKQRSKDRKVLVARAAEIAAKRAELAKAQEALSEALQRNIDWSDTSVPLEVQQALGGASEAIAAPLEQP